MFYTYCYSFTVETHVYYVIILHTHSSNYYPILNAKKTHYVTTEIMIEITASSWTFQLLCNL